MFCGGPAPEPRLSPHPCSVLYASLLASLPPATRPALVFLIYFFTVINITILLFRIRSFSVRCNVFARALVHVVMLVASSDTSRRLPFCLCDSHCTVGVCDLL